MNIMGTRTGRMLLLIGLVSAVVLISAIIWNDLNFSFFVALLFNDVKEFASSGTITSNFMPIGYSGFVGSCVKVGGIGSIPACQAFIYIGILLAAFWFLKLGGTRGVLLALGTLAVALHPMLVLNVWRIHDGNPTVLLLLGFLASGIVFLRKRDAWSVIIFGVFTGLLLTVRINAILLVLPALFVVFKKSEEKLTAGAKKAILFLVSAMIVFAAVNMAIKQAPIFFPQHGLYNFFAGSNEYTSKYLLKDYSGENSLGEALKARGFSSSAETFKGWLSFPSETYKEFAVDYIKNHPFEYLKLTALKLFTFFRPGYHMGENFSWDSGEGLKRFSKIILSLPVFAWAFLVYKTRKSFFDKENVFVLLSAALYLAPFLIANADPRFRFPLDIIFIADSFRRIGYLKDNPSTT
ncbi:MAG: hypothetical protein Q8P01_02965 [bacterium]|nr:hypothetical protein [bacterium]